MDLKAEMLKVEVTNSLGADLEDRLDNEVKTANELAGAAAALDQAATKVPTDLIAKAKEDPGIKDGLDESEVRGLVIKYLGRAGDYLRSISQSQQQKATLQGGCVEGLRCAMKMIQKKRDVSAAKLKTLIALAKEQAAAEERGEEPPRTAAEVARKEHGTVADRRAAAKQAKKNTKKKTTKKKTTKKKTTKA
jgi:hypothetical protein